MNIFLDLFFASFLVGGVADRDGRLKSGDHILHINDENLYGMSSDLVAGKLIIFKKTSKSFLIQVFIQHVFTVRF